MTHDVGGRLAGPTDVDLVAETLALAFATDPVWGLWAFADVVDRSVPLRAYWRPFVAAGLKYDGVFMTPGAEAVAVWVPPGLPEMDADDEASFETVISELFGDRAGLLEEGFESFRSNRSTAPPHWYLSLLATHPDHRGSGLGMRLVGEVLAMVDAAGLPAYLESTNPANDSRYAAAGFQRHGAFSLPAGPTVTTMRRPAVSG